jgi:transglutaminase-like putative cysteine protease
MPLHVALTHRTQYRFDRPVELGPHIVRLRPAPHCRTPILAYSLTVEPTAHFLNWQQDPFGNFLGRIVVPDKAKEFTATVDLVADMATINPFDFFVEEGALNWPFAYEAALARELGPYLDPIPTTPIFDGYLGEIGRTGAATIDFVCGINRKLSQDISYRVRMEPGVQAPEETLASRSGSCRDSGWLLVQVLRCLGLAARFVSGYLVQLRPDADKDGAREDFTDLHAWAEVYIPGAGWIGLDRPGPAGRRRPYPAGCHPDPDQRRPHHRHAWRSGGRLLGQHAGQAAARDAPRGKTLQRRAMAADPGHRCRRRRAVAGRRCAPQHGRRADLRSGRRRRSA